MREILTYVVAVIVCSGVLAALYALLLERRTAFSVCRRYLLASVVLAAVIPALKIPVWEGRTLYAAPHIAAGEMTAETVAAPEPSPTATPQMLCLLLYFAGVAVAAGALAAQLLRMRRLAASAERTECEGFTLLRVNDDIASFSFFGRIFISASADPDDLPVIVAHEAAHIRRRHSAERVAMELLKALLWWNPFVWAAARRLTEVQEYEADSDVLDSGYDVSNYINTLLKHLFGYSPDIANGLRDSLTKKRLKMMRKNQKGRYALLRMAAIVPVVGGLFTAFSLTAKPDNIVAAAAAQQTLSPTQSDADSATLILVDRQVRDRSELGKLDASIIESVIVVKNEEQKRAFEAYGDTSGNVVLITTTDADAALRSEGRMPLFEGGDADTFRQWVMQRLRFPQEAMEVGVAGHVVAAFVVDDTGSVGNIEILHSTGEIFSKEVERVLSLSPAWTPAEDNNGKAVSMRFTMPIDFAVFDGGGTMQTVKGSEKAADAIEGPIIDEVKVVGFGKQ